MYRAFNDYLSRIKLSAPEKLYEDIKSFIQNDENTEAVSVLVNFNRFIVDVRQKNYSVEDADRAFRAFTEYIAFPYSHMAVRYNEKTRVKYRLASCSEDKSGFALDILYS